MIDDPINKYGDDGMMEDLRLLDQQNQGLLEILDEWLGQIKVLQRRIREV